MLYIGAPDLGGDLSPIMVLRMEGRDVLFQIFQPQEKILGGRLRPHPAQAHV